jgi:prepilin-type N-terminal cleavage/methylation domain-containing protein
MGSPCFPRRAFTLVELLVATSLLLSVVTVATVALSQMMKVVRRVQATQDLHDAASQIHKRLTRQVSAMHPCTAVWLHEDKVAETVELVFMYGEERAGSIYDQPLPKRRDPVPALLNTDQRWIRWFWSKKTGHVSIAEGRGERSFLVDRSSTAAYWPFTANAMTGADLFLVLPQPQRDKGTGPQAVLDQNQWNTGFPGDVGDYEDLTNTAVPVLTNCTSLTIQIVDLNNTTPPPTANGTGNTGVIYAASGAYADARDHPDRLKAPSIVRLLFTLTNYFVPGDDQTKVEATYSFSASTPHAIRY